MEQLSINFDETNKTDFERIKAAFNREITNPEYDKYLNIVPNKDGSISIKAKNILVAKIKLTRNSSYIEVRSEYEKNFSNYDMVCSSKNWSRVKISGISEALGLAKQLSIIYMEKLLELGGEYFGCCHRYVECSDALKCLHPDLLTSLACLYKKNLDAGKVFYGKNKNT